MRISTHMARPRRRHMAVLVGLLLAGIPGVVLASHEFFDVPDANLFHDDIAAIAEAGITAGFGDGGYHPSAAVTRQSMAAFMHRGFGHAAMVIAEPPVSAGLAVAAGVYMAGDKSVRLLNVDVPGASNPFTPSQLVVLHGHVEFDTSMDVAEKGCPCQFGAVIEDTTFADSTFAQSQVFESSSETPGHYSFETEGILIATPGLHTYSLNVFMASRNDTTNSASFEFDQQSSLTAMTFPFPAAAAP
jgi:hypothetical protein